jgi:TonB family protein
VKIAPLVALLLAACDSTPRTANAPLSEQQRLWIWARLVSHERRVAALAGNAAGERALRDLEQFRSEVRDRHRLTDDEITVLAKEAERLRWKESSACLRSDEVIYGHALVVPPLRLTEPKLAYTPEACANGVEGVVLAGVVISTDGRPTSIEILKGLPDGLDERARASVEEAEWAPALLCGEPVRVHYIVSVAFRLPCSSAGGGSASR